MLQNDQFSLSGMMRGFLYLFLCLVSVLFFAWLIDFLALGGLWNDRSRPTWTEEFIMRTIFAGFIAVVGVVLFLKLNPPGVKKRLSGQPFRNDVPGWGWISFSEKSRQWAIGLVIFFSVGFLYVFYDNPIQFRDISSDQKPVENFSALFSLASSIIFLISGILLRKNRLNFSGFYSAVAWLFSLLFFVITMEEIAWTQGVFFFETPEAFKDNSQGELNFHNYATYQFELAYYFSTFLFFIVIPFFNERKSAFEQIPVLGFFMPSRFMVYIGAMALAYNYDLWNNIFFQISFFITLLILIYYAWIDGVDNHKILLTLLIIAYVASQSSFLLYGHRVTRTPCFKEYKEFFIPLTFLFYSLEVLLRVRLLRKERVSQ